MDQKKSYTIHLVSHTHWDREWYLPFQVFRLKLVHLIDGLLDLLQQDPNFRYFTLDGQTIVLEDYLEMRPEREEELRSHIQADRILVGPWYVLPDEFLVSPEALIRNLLEGERICRRFGPKMMVGYIPDPFGHIGQMPQILRGFGISSASLWRGLTDEPCEFWWRAPDGSQVLMAYLRDSYGNAAGLPSHDPRFATELLRLRDTLAPYAAADSLLLMYGTDHMEPPTDTSAAIAAASPLLEGSRLIHSTLPRYLEAVENEIQEKDLRLPVITGELRACQRSPLLPGVLSTRIWLKQRNQACQSLLELWAEPFSAWASLIQEPGRPLTHSQPESDRIANPAPLLRQAWRLLLQCHPHDSICGCSIDAVHAEMQPRFDQVEQIGQALTQQSLVALAEAADTRSNSPLDPSGTGLAVLVFNPTHDRRTDLVQVEIQLLPEIKDFELVNASGQAVAYQVEGRSSLSLINFALTPQDFRSSLNMIHDGRVIGMVIRGFTLRREQDTVYVETILAEQGEPDLNAFESGLQQIETLLADPGVTRYIVRSQSSEKVGLSFVAQGVPGPGFQAYWIRTRPGDNRPPTAVQMGGAAKALLPLADRLSRLPGIQKWIASRTNPAKARPPYRIENEYFVVEASQPDGSLKILDKTTNLLYQGLNRFVDGGDCGDEYNYAPPLHDQIVSRTEVRSIQIVRSPVQETLSIQLEMRLPKSLTPDRQGRSPKTVVTPIHTRIALAPGVPRIEVQTVIDNQVQDHRLRVHFPAPFAVNGASYAGHFEIVQRPIGLPKFDETWVEQPRPEAPQRQFTQISNGKVGLLIANRGLPEIETIKSSLNQTEFALTLLRCVGWLSRDDLSTRRGHAGPALPTPGAQMPGKYSFDYAILPHAAGVGLLAAQQQAYAFTAPLRALTTGVHAGILPASSCLVDLQPPEFILSAIKIAEDNRGWVLRGYSISVEPLHALIKPSLPFNQAWLVNLAEQPLLQLFPERDGSLSVPVGTHQVVSIKFPFS